MAEWADGQLNSTVHAVAVVAKHSPRSRGAPDLRGLYFFFFIACYSLHVSLRPRSTMVGARPRPRCTRLLAALVALLALTGARQGVTLC